jgi:hypothetical protein
MGFLTLKVGPVMWDLRPSNWVHLCGIRPPLNWSRLCGLGLDKTGVRSVGRNKRDVSGDLGVQSSGW